jgi:ribonuclease T2
MDSIPAPNALKKMALRTGNVCGTAGFAFCETNPEPRPRRMKTRLASFLVCGLLAFTPFASAKHHHHRDDSAAGGGQFDYYLLSLSWAPNYCAGHLSDHSSECRIGGHNAFVLHGLWPQANSGSPPMSCTNPAPVPTATVDHMLTFMPSRSLIQHEWEKHGTCTGLAARVYFAQAEQAFTHVQVPRQYRNLDHEQQFSVPDLENSFAEANDAPLQAFRVSCHAGDLVSLEVCVDKNLRYRSCTQSVRECPVSQVDMRPPQ